MKTATFQPTNANEREKLNEIFRSAIVDKEVNSLKEKQAKVKHLGRALAGKTLVRKA